MCVVRCPTVIQATVERRLSVWPGIGATAAEGVEDSDGMRVRRARRCDRRTRMSSLCVQPLSVGAALAAWLLFSTDLSVSSLPRLPQCSVRDEKRRAHRSLPVAHSEAMQSVATASRSQSCRRASQLQRAADRGEARVAAEAERVHIALATGKRPAHQHRADQREEREQRSDPPSAVKHERAEAQDSTPLRLSSQTVPHPLATRHADSRCLAARTTICCRPSRAGRAQAGRSQQSGQCTREGRSMRVKCKSA